PSSIMRTSGLTRAVSPPGTATSHRRQPKLSPSGRASVRPVACAPGTDETSRVRTSKYAAFAAAESRELVRGSTRTARPFSDAKREAQHNDVHAHAVQQRDRRPLQPRHGKGDRHRESGTECRPTAAEHHALHQ